MGLQSRSWAKSEYAWDSKHLILWIPIDLQFYHLTRPTLWALDSLCTNCEWSWIPEVKTVAELIYDRSLHSGLINWCRIVKLVWIDQLMPNSETPLDCGCNDLDWISPLWTQPGLDRSIVNQPWIDQSKQVELHKWNCSRFAARESKQVETHKWNRPLRIMTQDYIIYSLVIDPRQYSSCSYSVFYPLRKKVVDYKLLADNTLCTLLCIS